MSKSLRPLSKGAKITLVLVIVLFIVGIAGTITLAATGAKYSDKFFPNTLIGGINVSDKTRAEAAGVLNSAFDAYLAAGFTFIADGKTITLDQADFGLNDPDISNDPARLDADDTLETAFSQEHSKNKMADGFKIAAGFIKTNRFDLKVIFNRDLLTTSLRQKLAGLEQPFAEPTLVWKNEIITVAPGHAGDLFDIDSGLEHLAKQMLTLRSQPITLVRRQAMPTVSDKFAAELATQAAELLARAPLTLTSGETIFETATSTRAGWFSVKRTDGTSGLGINPETLDKYLDVIAKDIEVAPQDARFEIKDGRVAAFAESRAGKTVDREALRRALETDWIDQAKTRVEIPLKITAAKVDNGDVNDLGIKEILGVGTSSWNGSPPNRIKNIKNAIRKLNGILIKPDEEFSLIAALAPFTSDGGWLPELVIKGDKIKPELGGGACQIGTTTFRAAMMSGLPITERANHSLAISYYNDPANKNPGTDATIYEPHPDLRFKNDTGHYILFQAAMNENNKSLAFTFWGTRDGRRGSYTPPLVSKSYPAGAPQTQLTTDLPPGKKNCEGPFRGADASFTYTIKKPDGTEVSRVFTSHYRPMAQLCMVGATAAEVAAGALNPPAAPGAPVNTNSNTPVPATNTNTPPGPTNQ